MRSTIVRAIGFLCVLAMAVGLSACGGDDPTAAGGPERYCELVAELEEIGSEAYEAVEADENATEEDFLAASRAFTEDASEEFDELVEVAPAEIKEDVDLLVKSIRGQVGLGEEVPAEDAAAAEERINAWEDENC